MPSCRVMLDVPKGLIRFAAALPAACRYLAEVTGVLAAEAPEPREAPERALAGGTPYVILDRKTRRHLQELQVLGYRVTITSAA